MAMAAVVHELPHCDKAHCCQKGDSFVAPSNLAAALLVLFRQPHALSRQLELPGEFWHCCALWLAFALVVQQQLSV